MPRTGLYRERQQGVKSPGFERQQPWRQSGLACDGVLVEASLQHEPKATAHGARTFVILLKQRPETEH